MIETARTPSTHRRAGASGARKPPTEPGEITDWVGTDRTAHAERGHEVGPSAPEENFHVVVGPDDVHLELIDALKGMYFFG